jgi:hypothetical protein
MKRILHSASSHRIHIARIILLVWLAINVFYLSISLPAKYQRLYNLDPTNLTGNAFSGWTAEQVQAVRVELDLRPEFIATTMFLASLICLLCFWGIAGLLFWRKSDTWFGLLVALILFMTGPGFSGLFFANQSLAPIWFNQLNTLLVAIAFSTFFVFLYLFPNGIFVPRFTRYLAVLPYLVFLLVGAFPNSSTIDSIGTVIALIYVFGGLVSQIYRYFRISNPEERQQTKWVVFALGIFIVLLVAGEITPVLFSSLGVGTRPGFWDQFLGNGVIGILTPALIPIAIGISILRYHLWDIDVIIRKTLVYAALTLTLALVYFGSVILLQNLFTAVGGQQSAVVTVISTLLIAALFTPLRKRIQSDIDRRFYRKKYDAEKTITAFSASLRQEVNLEQIGERLLSVVEETMQPEKVSLWLRPGKGKT